MLQFKELDFLKRKVTLLRSNKMEPWIIALLLFGPFFLIVLWSFVYTQKKVLRFKETLKCIAKELKLKYVPEPNVLSLFFDGLRHNDFEKLKLALKYLFQPSSISSKVIGKIKFKDKEYNIEISSKIIKFKEWSIIITYIILEPIPFFNKLYFEISSHDVFHKFEKLIMKDIQFNVPKFDSKFLVLGNNEALVKKIIDMNLVNNLIHIHENARIIYQPPMLYFEEEGYITDAKYLKWIILIMLNVLKNLHELSENQKV